MNIFKACKTIVQGSKHSFDNKFFPKNLHLIRIFTSVVNSKYTVKQTFEFSTNLYTVQLLQTIISYVKINELVT